MYTPFPPQVTLRRQNWRRLAVIVLVLAVGLLSATLTLWRADSYAAEQNNNAIAQTFTSNAPEGTLVAGALVSSVPDDTDAIELTTEASAQRLLGVVNSLPLVSLSSGINKVPVVLAGTTTVLVSDINGPISSGDKITSSPIAGVGMRATANSQIVGTAQADSNPEQTIAREITDKNGQRYTVQIERIPVQVGVAYYQAPGSDFLPPVIQNIANSIAGRPVSLIRVLFAGILILASFISAATLVFVATKSAMTGLGRNPLAARSIKRGLYQSVIVSLVVVGVATVISYLIISL